MKKLLKFEFRRLLHFKPALVCLIIAAVYALSDAFLSNLDILEGYEEATGTPALELMLSSMDLLLFLVAIFSGLYACNDYSNNTLKNIYSKGFDRTEVYLAKMVGLAAYTAIICAASWIISFLSGVALSGVGSANGAYVGALFASLLALMAYASFCFMFSTLIKKTGGSIAFCILGPMLISLVLSLIDIIFITKDIDFLLTEYWISGYFNTLTLYSFPVFSAKILTISYIMSVVYAAGSVLLGIVIVRKQDV